jgi:predicted Zn finger-like uncharacterized protein
MIIQCDSCKAKFKLNEDLIKGKGARVKCRKCSDYIIIMKPGYEHMKAQYIDGVRDKLVADRNGMEVGGERDGLAAEESTPLEHSERGAETETPQDEWVGEPSAEEEGLEGEEEREEAASDNIDKAFEDFLGSIQGEEKRERREELQREFDSPPPPLESSPLEVNGGQEMEDPLLITSDESVGFVSDSDDEGELKGEKLELSIQDEKLELQDTLDLSFGISDEGETAGEDLPPVDGGPAQVPSMDEPVSSMEISQDRSEIPSEVEKPSPFEYVPTEIPQKRKSSGLKKFLRLLLVFLIIVAGGGAYLAFTESGNQTIIKYAPYLRSFLSSKSPGANKTFNITNLIGYNESNQKEGKIFVIKGEVVNLSKDVKSGLILKGDILGEGSRVLATTKVYGGNFLSQDELKELGKSSIERALQNKLGKNLANIDIQPGSSIPFMVVFFNVQGDIKGYRVESME